MKLEDQVCTLEQSKKLSELGVRVGGLWAWCNWEYFSWRIQLHEYVGCPDLQLFQAYTVSELMRMISMVTASNELVMSTGKTTSLEA